MTWQPIETAPRDGTPILAWCDHAADPYFISNGLTIYGGHAEDNSHAEDGLNILIWGGGWVDDHGYMPDWWFVMHSEFEVAANPTHWMPLPKAPAP